MSYTKKHSKHGELYGAVLILETELRSFVDFLAKDFVEIAINGKTKDGTNINFSDLNEFISYSNFEKRKIVEFELTCSNEEQSVDIKFQNDRFFFKPKVISYYLRYNNQNWGFKFEDDLRQELKEFRPYYSFLTYLDLKMGLPLLLVAIAILFFSVDYLLKVAGLTGLTNTDYNNSGSNNSSWIVGVAWWIPIYLSGYFINLFRNFLFPVLFIATGKQVKEYRKRRNIAYVIFGVVLLGIAINIISDLITNAT
ncbi:hypothetical protein GCM10027284_09580 [Cyclobacterium sediminis]